MSEQMLNLDGYLVLGSTTYGMAKVAWHTLASPREQKGALADQGCSHGITIDVRLSVEIDRRADQAISPRCNDVTMQRCNNTTMLPSGGTLQDLTGCQPPASTAGTAHSRIQQTASTDGDSPGRRRGGGTDDDGRLLLHTTTTYYVVLVRTTFPPFESPNGPRV